MINKKKLHFYQLTIIFTAISIIALMYNWGNWSKADKSESMMTDTMGKMMKSMHLGSVKMSDLFKSEAMANNDNNQNSQVQEEGSYIKDLFNLSTIVVVVLIPFIIAGTVFLAIIWLK